MGKGEALRYCLGISVARRHLSGRGAPVGKAYPVCPWRRNRRTPEAPAFKMIWELRGGIVDNPGTEGHF